MSGLAPNSTNITLVKGPVAIANQLVTHPEYQYWCREWYKIRDVLAGSHVVKRAGERYLPKMNSKGDNSEYETYLQRAVFYNMAAQTRDGMQGQIFRRDPKLDNFPKDLMAKLLTFGRDGTPHVNFTKTVVSEQIGMGRFGVLVDSPEGERTVPDAYCVGYTCENILDWTIELVYGRYALTRVLLREFTRKNDARYFSPYTYDSIYRELLLTGDDESGYEYVQNTYFDEAPPVEVRQQRPGAAGQKTVDPKYTDGVPTNASAKRRPTMTLNKPAKINGQPVPTPGVPQPMDTVTPRIRGQVLEYIPFVFFGSTSNTGDVERPPLLDIVDLNISHYQTYAELQHGRRYTALPVYYAQGLDDEAAGEYHIGPGMVWECPIGAKPGIIEFTGKGLTSLETALQMFQDQITAIGGRMMPGQSATSESSDQTMLRQANEYSLLLNVIQACDSGMTMVLRYWLAFLDHPMVETTELRYRINIDFLGNPIGAREMRAIQLMYQAGVIGVDVLYGYLRKAEVIDAEVDLEDFIATLKDPTSFINQPDVLAMQQGYASRQQQIDQTHLRTEEGFQERQIEIEEQEIGMAADESEQKVALTAEQVKAAKRANSPAARAASAKAAAAVAAGGGVGSAPEPVIPKPPQAGLSPGADVPPKPGAGKQKVAGASGGNANPSLGGMK